MNNNGLNNGLITPSENSKIFGIEVNGVIINVLIFNYNDRIFVGITHTGTFGSFVSVRRSQSTSVEENREDLYETNSLFGDDRLEYHVAARTLAESMQTEKPVLFGIALRDPNFETLKIIRKALVDNKFW